MRNMSEFVKRMIAGVHFLRDREPAETKAASHPGILAITADLGFYSCVLSAASSSGWTVVWASSMKRGLQICGSRVIRIVIYDRNLPYVDWRYALDHLSSVASDARILLAAPQVDEDLWRNVLRLRGYDVLARSATSEQLKRELRFAWLSLQETKIHEAEEMATGMLGTPIR